MLQIPVHAQSESRAGSKKIGFMWRGMKQSPFEGSFASSTLRALFFAIQIATFLIEFFHFWKILGKFSLIFYTFHENLRFC